MVVLQKIQFKKEVFIVSKIIKAIIQLRRDNDYNFEPIKNTFIPANGEVVLVDTARHGLQFKVGDGRTVWANLAYVNNQNGIVRGYYKDGRFYEDQAYIDYYEALENSIYIDANTSKVYIYDGNSYVGINQNLAAATAQQAGIMKLYNNKGQNIDGTITQKLFTDEINKKFEVNIDEELLIFD